MIRQQASIRRKCFSLCLVLMMLVGAAGAEGLFPSMDKMFGTAMPSVGVVLGRTADETADTARGKEETYRGFTYDDYTAFGAYLAGAGAAVEVNAATEKTVSVTLTVRGAAMEFAYDWDSQTATAVYPSGTRPETEKAAVEDKASILPKLYPDGRPMPSLGEALGRYPDEEIPEADGGNTEVFRGVTETDFNTFSVYLGEKGAALADYQAVGNSFSASIQVEEMTIRFTYDTQSFEARVTYPKGTYDEWLDYAKTQYESAAKLLDEGKTDEAISVLLTIPNYSGYGPALEANPELVAAAAAREEKLKQFRTVGSRVTFGTYPQTSGGNDNTPIEWQVLAVDGNKVLLMSKYGLDAKPYNTEWVDITWEKCTLRTWLNGTFLNKAFTSQEQNAILMTNVDNSNSQGYSKWSTSGGNNTQDKIFLLSYAEANKYLGVTRDNSNNTKSCVAPTAYAIKQGAYTSSIYKTADGAAAGWWWLRSPGIYQIYAASVFTVGSLYYYDVNYDSGCVRPALWINLESDIF